MNNPYPFAPSDDGADIHCLLASLRADEPSAPARLWAHLATYINGRINSGLERIARFPYLKREDLEHQFVSDFSLGLARLRHNTLTGDEAEGYLKSAVYYSAQHFLRQPADDVVPPPKARKKHSTIKRRRGKLRLGVVDPWEGFHVANENCYPTSAHSAQLFEHPETTVYDNYPAGLFGWYESADPSETAAHAEKQRQCQRILRSVLPLMLRECTTKHERYIVKAMLAGLGLDQLLLGYPGLSTSRVSETLDRLDKLVAQRRYHQKYMAAA